MRNEKPSLIYGVLYYKRRENHSKPLNNLNYSAFRIKTVPHSKGALMHPFLKNIRYGVRRLYKRPAFTAIADRMRGIFPRIQDENVVVEYRHVGMGFAGRLGGDLVPTVTLELQGLTFDFLLLSFLGPMLYGATTVPAGIPMPSFAATLTGEDLASAGPS